MKIVTAAEMRTIDRATSERFGVPSLTLMENAGSAVADYVLAHYPTAQRIVVFCGKGNNGGDGFVAARQLHQAGKTVQVILLADRVELRGDAAVDVRQIAHAGDRRPLQRRFEGRPAYGLRCLQICISTQFSAQASNRQSVASMPKPSRS